MKNIILDKEYCRNKVYSNKALKGYSFSGYWDDLYHYSKRIRIYGGKYLPLDIANQNEYKPLIFVDGGFIFRDIENNKKIKLTSHEISKLQKSYIYKCVSLDIEQLKDDNLMLY